MPRESYLKYTYVTNNFDYSKLFKLIYDFKLIYNFFSLWTRYRPLIFTFHKSIDYRWFTIEVYAILYARLFQNGFDLRGKGNRCGIIDRNIKLHVNAVVSRRISLRNAVTFYRLSCRFHSNISGIVGSSILPSSFCNRVAFEVMHRLLRGKCVRREGKTQLWKPAALYDRDRAVARSVGQGERWIRADTRGIRFGFDRRRAYCVARIVTKIIAAFFFVFFLPFFLDAAVSRLIISGHENAFLVRLLTFSNYSQLSIRHRRSFRNRSTGGIRISCIGQGVYKRGKQASHDKYFHWRRNNVTPRIYVNFTTRATLRFQPWWCSCDSFIVFVL